MIKFVCGKKTLAILREMDRRKERDGERALGRTLQY